MTPFCGTSPPPHKGISFLEAWVKFRADLVTRAVGLDVGRTVFHALNRVEIALSLATFLLIVKDMREHPSGIDVGWCSFGILRFTSVYC